MQRIMLWSDEWMKWGWWWSEGSRVLGNFGIFPGWDGPLGGTGPAASR